MQRWTYREIGSIAGTSATTEHRHIQALQKAAGIPITLPAKGQKATELTKEARILAEKARVAVSALDDVLIAFDTLRERKV